MLLNTTGKIDSWDADLTMSGTDRAFARSVHALLEMIGSRDFHSPQIGDSTQLSRIAHEDHILAEQFLRCLKSGNAGERTVRQRAMCALDEHPLVDLGCGARFTQVPKVLFSEGIQYYLGIDPFLDSIPIENPEVNYPELRACDLEHIGNWVEIATACVDMSTGLSMLKDIGFSGNVFASSIDCMIISEEYGLEVARKIPEVVTIGRICALLRSEYIVQGLPGRFLDGNLHEVFPEVPVVQDVTNYKLPVWQVIGDTYLEDSRILYRIE